MPRVASRGIGVFFNTRKGPFQYKISYHVAIMIYHCVSSPVSPTIGEHSGHGWSRVEHWEVSVYARFDPRPDRCSQLTVTEPPRHAERPGACGHT